jgi:hypothetical protein
MVITARLEQAEANAGLLSEPDDQQIYVRDFQPRISSILLFEEQVFFSLLNCRKSKLSMPMMPSL